MTQPSPPRPPRRSSAEYRWTKQKIMTFLRRLSLTGSVAAAAREVGMSRQSAYRLRARLGAEFAGIWDEGLRVGGAMRRAGLPRADKVTLPVQGDTREAR